MQGIRLAVQSKDRVLFDDHGGLWLADNWIGIVSGARVLAR